MIATTCNFSFRLKLNGYVYLNFSRSPSGEKVALISSLKVGYCVSDVMCLVRWLGQTIP